MSTTQTSIFDQDLGPAARESDRATSRRAGQHHPMLGQQRRDVLAAIAHCERYTPHTPGATAYEVMLALSFGNTPAPQQNVIARRLTDLATLELIEDSGITRPGSSTRHLTAWRITEAGREALA